MLPPWRCPLAIGKQCKAFWWTSAQPWFDLNSWKYLSQPGGIPETPPVEALRQMVQEACQHAEVSRNGTNQYRLREKCKVCEKILKDEPKKTHETSSTTASSSETENHPEFQEFQEFLRWKAMRAGKGKK